MDYNKRRWLERIQQQQQEEEPRDVYPIPRSTYFSNDCGYSYTAIVEVYSKYTLIELYKTTIKKKVNAPLWAKVLLHLLDGKSSDDSDPIVKPRRISNNDSVSRTIWRMIVDYEIPLYQRYMAEEEDEELKIDYAAELGKRRQRLVNIDQEPQQQTFQQDYAISDYLSSGEVVEADPLQELAKKTGRDPNSLKNLLQFRDKKSS